MLGVTFCFSLGLSNSLRFSLLQCLRSARYLFWQGRCLLWICLSLGFLSGLLLGSFLLALFLRSLPPLGSAPLVLVSHVALDYLDETQLQLSHQHLSIVLIDAVKLKEDTLVQVMIYFFCTVGHKQPSVGEDVLHLDRDDELTSHTEVGQVCDLVRHTC